jgi:hypothetical protein
MWEKLTGTEIGGAWALAQVLAIAGIIALILWGLSKWEVGE